MSGTINNDASPPSSSSSVHLSRQQKADAIRNVKDILSQVRTDWEYIPPRARPAPPATPLSRAVSSASAASTFSRSGVLGAWRPTTDPDSSPAPQEEPEAIDSWDEEWNSTEESSDSDSDSDDLDDAPRKSRSKNNRTDTTLQRALSYRRPSTPPLPASSDSLHRKRKRKQPLRSQGTWKQRVDDSDYEIPVPSSSPFKWDSAASVPSQRRLRRRHEREMMRENPGLRTWLRRRDQWTGADAEGWVPVGKSRFVENPMTRLVTPSAYQDIYQRCVVRAGELPVPVNLANMIDALVQGWKSDDLWPPKPTEVAVSTGINGAGGAGARKVTAREDGTKSMSGRVRKYLGIR
ncbi:hypothetical protein BDD12DRAFT_806855 [Trichophaea hybrida]|nr:hypothetical protein BDD12DRAFT_806855 [Trichophaea hybrida]